MLANQALKAFIPTTAPDKAKFFYQQLLGLELLSEDEYALEFNANGVLLRVITVPELKPQEFTILGWNVPDIRSLIGSMNKKGIFCEKFSFLKQDDLGIWTAPGGSKVAWFKDPDGNVLSLTE
jgi:predicted enzyme related to lactoylglutathione lyase